MENISNVPGALSGSMSPLEGLADSHTVNEHRLSKLKVISHCTNLPEKFRLAISGRSLLQEDCNSSR